jgi:hypothetical protein
MRSRPPRAGTWLLRPLVPGGDSHPLLGDLEEEFAEQVVPRVGASAARRWYLKQCLAATGPLLSTGLAPRRAAVVASLLLVALPLLLVELTRAYVLSQIPLKEGRGYSGDFLWLQLLGVAALCAGVARLLRVGLRRDAAPAAGDALVVVATALGALTAAGPVRPAAFWVVGLPVIVFSVAMGALDSRRRGISLEDIEKAT